MPDLRRRIPLFPLDGGLDTATNRFLAHPRTVRVATNAYPGLDGILRKRPGRVRLPAQVLGDISGDKVLALFQLSNSSVSWNGAAPRQRHPLLCAALDNSTAWGWMSGFPGDTWVVSSDGGAPPNPIVLGTYISAFSACVCDGKLVIAEDMNEYDTRYWDGGSGPVSISLPSITMGASPNKVALFRYVSSHANRLWGVDNNFDTTYDRPEPAKLWYSAYLDFFDFTDADPYTGAGFIYVEKDDGDAITGLSSSFMGDLYVFKNRSFYRISGPTAPFQMEAVSENIGCSGHNTIKQVGKDLFWQSHRGVHSLSATVRYGDVEESFLSAKVQSYFDDMIPDLARLAWATVIPEQRLYVIAFPTTADTYYCTRMMAYNYEKQTWAGPWDVDTGFVTTVMDAYELPGPTVVMCGDDGTTAIGGDYGMTEQLDFTKTVDYDGEGDEAEIVMEIETQRIQLASDQTLTACLADVALAVNQGTTTDLDITTTVDNRTPVAEAPTTLPASAPDDVLFLRSEVSEIGRTAVVEVKVNDGDGQLIGLVLETSDAGVKKEYLQG
jgi:hypothetical protein